MPADRRGTRRSGGLVPLPASPPDRAPPPSRPPPSLEDSDLPLPSDNRAPAFKVLAPITEALRAKLEEFKQVEIPEEQLIQFHRVAFGVHALLLALQAAVPTTVPSLWWAYISQPILGGIPTNTLHWFWYLLGVVLWLAYAAYHVTQGAILRRTESGWPYAPLQVVGLALFPFLNVYGSYVLFSEAASRLGRETQLQARAVQAKSAVLGALALSVVSWGLLLARDLGVEIPEIAVQASQWLRAAAQFAALGLMFWMMTKLIRRFAEEGGGIDPSSLAEEGLDVPLSRGPSAPPPKLTVFVLLLVAVGGTAVYYRYKDPFECPRTTSLATTRTAKGQRVLYCEKSGEPNGPWRVAGKDGVEQFSYLRGKIAGAYMAWYPDGTKRATGTYMGQSKEGLWRQYSEAGVLLTEEIYAGNVLEGPATRFYPSGKAAEVATYSGGKLNGKFVAYHENGKKAEEGTYKDGNKVGRWTSWNVSGLVVDEKEHTPESAKAAPGEAAPGGTGANPEAGGLPPVAMAIHEVTEKRLFAGRSPEWWGERLNRLKQQVAAGEASATVYELTKRRALLNGLEVQEGPEVKVRIAAAQAQGGTP